ncbi:MAG: inositol monophosphatase family protein [Gemmataceae bacterium]
MTDENRMATYLGAAKEAALAAAKVLAEWREKFQVREKGRFDLVTEADEGSQKAIFEYLGGRFPDHRLLGEEGDAAKSRPTPDAPPTWIIDPIDGTTNYVHDCPFYCISIGLQVAGKLVVGVVYDPVRDEMFAAAEGLGAYLNDKPIQPTPIDSLGQSLLATGFPADLRGYEHVFELWQHFSYNVQALRRTGSTALNLAYVACGRFDGFWAFDNKVWDVAGGVVLVQEAGGKITNVDGTPYDPFTPDSLASNGVLHPVLLKEMEGRYKL